MDRTPLLGLVGLTILLSAMYASSHGYHGLFGGETFSVRNHFVSELGNSHKNSLSFIHNGGLVIGGALLTLTAASLWQISLIGSCVMTASMFGVMLIGVVPEDKNLLVHLVIAMGVFGGTAFGVAAFGVSILLNRRAPWRVGMVLLSGMTLACFVAFMAMPKDHLMKSIRHPMEAVRPDVHWLAVFEWLYIGCLVIWLIAITAFAMRYFRILDSKTMADATGWKTHSLGDE